MTTTYLSTLSKSRHWGLFRRWHWIRSGGRWRRPRCGRSSRSATGSHTWQIGSIETIRMVLGKMWGKMVVGETDQVCFAFSSTPFVERSITYMTECNWQLTSICHLQYFHHCHPHPHCHCHHHQKRASWLKNLQEEVVHHRLHSSVAHSVANLRLLRYWSKMLE